MSRLVSLEHSLRSVAHSLRREPVVWVANALIVAVAILLPLMLQLGLESAFPFMRSLSADPEASIYFSPDIKPAALSAGRADIDARLTARRALLPDARLQATFVSRDEAWKRFVGSAGEKEAADALTAIGANPLPDSVVVRATGVSPAQLEAMLADLRSVAGVDAVDLDLDWARQMSSWVDVLRLVRTGLGIVLGLVVIAVTFQATRAQVLGDRDEITIARLIGATDGFVRRPFVLRGALLGLCGALVALLAATLLAWRAEPVLDSIRLAPMYLSWLQVAVVAAAAVVLGALGGYLCCLRYLR